MLPSCRPIDVADPETHRVAVLITFFFRASRLKLLFETLRALQTLPAASVETTIFTNSDDKAELVRIRRLIGKLDGPRFSVKISSHPEVAQRPRLLPWTHKSSIAAIGDAGSTITHVIYLEEDIQFTAANFNYFIRARPVLEPYGLIPGFARFEYNTTEDDIFNADQQGRQAFDRRPLVRTPLANFVALDVPYAAMFVLDRPMIAEYVASRSFLVDDSAALVQWGEPERAAMGLTWENVPAPYHHRTVVPLIPGTATPDSCCWVYHAANNYTNDYCPGPNFVLGKTRMDEIFAPGTVNLPAASSGVPNFGRPSGPERCTSTKPDTVV